MLYTVEVEKELIAFEFNETAEKIACIIDDCFSDEDGENPWTFLDGFIQELEVQERKTFTEHQINEFVRFAAIPTLLEYDFHVINAEEFVLRCHEVHFPVPYSFQ